MPRTRLEIIRDLHDVWEEQHELERRWTIQQDEQKANDLDERERALREELKATQR